MLGLFACAFELKGKTMGAKPQDTASRAHQFCNKSRSFITLNRILGALWITAAAGLTSGCLL